MAIVLEGLPIVDVSEKTNYRIKICVNFLGRKGYVDNITDKFLLDKINKFMHLSIDPNITYGFFQKSNYSNDYSIILSCHIQIDQALIKSLYDSISDDDLKVFGYSIADKDIIFLTEQKTLEYKYYDFIWHVSPNSFIQVNPGAAAYIHKTVKQLINPEYYFCALGGEMGIYVTALQKTTFTCLTNSKGIYDDCIANCNRENGFYLVDYERVTLKNYYRKKNMILVINISRNGLRNLAYQVTKIPFKQIIYIGCCDKSIVRDMKILTKVYTIDKIIKIDQFPQQNEDCKPINGIDLSFIKQKRKKQYSYIINLLLNTDH